MRITHTSVYVDDQDKALAFYTDILGFVKKTEIPLGAARWLTVVSPDDPDGTELLLEPNGIPSSQAFTKSLYEQGIPLTMFAVENVEAEYTRLKELGVSFSRGPMQAGTTVIAVFDDTCGNWIQIYQG